MRSKRNTRATSGKPSTWFPLEKLVSQELSECFPAPLMFLGSLFVFLFFPFSLFSCPFPKFQKSRILKKSRNLKMWRKSWKSWLWRKSMERYRKIVNSEENLKFPRKSQKSQNLKKISKSEQKSKNHGFWRKSWFWKKISKNLKFCRKSWIFKKSQKISETTTSTETNTSVDTNHTAQTPQNTQKFNIFQFLEMCALAWYHLETQILKSDWAHTLHDLCLICKCDHRCNTFWKYKPKQQKKHMTRRPPTQFLMPKSNDLGSRFAFC